MWMAERHGVTWWISWPFCASTLPASRFTGPASTAIVPTEGAHRFFGPMSSIARILAIALLLGTGLLGAGAVLHPVLEGDAATQLRLIAATSSWRAVHFAMLAGSALVMMGIWVRLVLDSSASTKALAPALGVITIGLAISALNISFMAGSGWRMAQLFQNGDASMAALFDATHPIGLVAARLGNFIIALGALVLGLVEWRDRSRPRIVAWLAWLAASAGFVGVAFFDEASRFTLAAAALLSGWQIVVGVQAVASGADGIGIRNQEPGPRN